MKYAIRSAHGSYLRNNGRGFQLFPKSHALEPEFLFDNIPAALHALEVRAAGSSGPSSFGTVLVGIEEIPGETKREVVPLDPEQVGGLKQQQESGLRFALVIPFTDGHAYQGEGSGHSTDLDRARLFSSSFEAAWSDHWAAGRFLVGVREVTTPPTLRVVELG